MALFMRTVSKRYRGFQPLVDTLEERRVLCASGVMDQAIAVNPAVNQADALPVPDLQFQPVASSAAEAAGVAAASGAAAVADPLTPDAPLSDTFLLNSNPGATHTIYLDFNGDTTSGTIWNTNFNRGRDIVTPAYDFTGDAGFSDAELQRIQDIWKRVAEDFAPFDVNVTTQDPGSDALINSGGNDTTWGVRVVIGGSGNWYASNVGGVAYVGSFNWNSDTPVFVFENNLGNGNEKYTAEAISHEAGHALGLSHDGNSSSSYYAGQGSGETSWAPIMGVGYYQNLTQWSKGEYAGANNQEDDLAIITTQNGFGYRADDHGNTDGTADALAVSGSTVTGSGIIEKNTDTDVFSFTTGAGLVDLTINPAARGANLDVLAELYDSNGILVASSNPADSLSSEITANLAAGQYFLHISGTGKGDPLTTGYTDYGSLGQYTISGTVADVSGTDSLAIAPLSAVKAEGNSGSTEFTFQVTRTGDLSTTSTVNWNVVGNGVTGADFVGGALPGGALQFDPTDTTKTITVMVQGDVLPEGDEQFSVVLSGASTDTTITTSSASGTILNDDVPPGITVTPTSGLVTSENGTSASFDVVLNSKPTDDVVITLYSSNTAEGTIDKSTLTFTPDDWDQAQTVTVTGVDDTVRDGTQTFSIVLEAATSNDLSYDGIDPTDVSVSNTDNERRGRGNGGGGGGGGRGHRIFGFSGASGWADAAYLSFEDQWTTSQGILDDDSSGEDSSEDNTGNCLGNRPVQVAGNAVNRPSNSDLLTIVSNNQSQHSGGHSHYESAVEQIFATSFGSWFD